MKPKLSWFDASKWAAVAAVAGGVVAAMVTPDTASVLVEWSTIIGTALLAAGGAAIAFAGAVKRRH